MNSRVSLHFLFLISSSVKPCCLHCSFPNWRNCSWAFLIQASLLTSLYVISSGPVKPPSNGVTSQNSLFQRPDLSFLIWSLRLAISTSWDWIFVLSVVISAHLSLFQSMVHDEKRSAEMKNSIHIFIVLSRWCSDNTFFCWFLDFRSPPDGHREDSYRDD